MEGYLNMKIGFAGRCFLSYFVEKLPEDNREWKVLNSSDEVKDIDTIIFTGGEDIDPSFYNETSTHSGFYTPRDTLEFSLFNKAVELGKNIIGVCRGHQLINVALGGSLYQDIFDNLHINHSGGVINWRYSTPLSNLYINVNSMHHQAVKKIGNGLTPTAYAKDGIIESMICKEKKILTFQFHPECLDVTKEFFKQFCSNPSLFF
jgi:putative glutamine amidotransferase